MLLSPKIRKDAFGGGSCKRTGHDFSVHRNLKLNKVFHFVWRGFTSLENIMVIDFEKHFEVKTKPFKANSNNSK